jgi:integrase
MSTHQRNPRVLQRHRTGLGPAAVALGALVAIAVTILFLALTSAGYTVRATSTIHTSSPSTHELMHEGIPLPLIQRQLGHSHLSTTGTYLEGINHEEIISTVHARRAPMMHASAGLAL